MDDIKVTDLDRGITADYMVRVWRGELEILDELSRVELQDIILGYSGFLKALAVVYPKMRALIQDTLQTYRDQEWS